MLLLALLSLPAWHGPLVLHHHTPACAIGRTWITNTLTTKSNVGIPGGLTNSVAAGPPAIVEDAQATVPRVLQGVNLFAQLNQLWPPLATALAACLLMLRRTGLHRPPLVLTTLLGVEAAHHCYARLRSYARGRSHTRPERSGASQLELWRKCLDEDTTISAADFIRGWFLPSQHKGTEVRLSELRRDNVAEFISYAVHSRRVDELDAVAGAEIERCICMVEERVAAEEAVIGFRFEEGYNDQLSAMTLNLDPPSSTMQPRPLLYYLLTDVLASTVTGAIMHARGFRRYSEGKLSYWHHSGDVAGPSDKMSDRMCRVTHLDVAGASGEATPLVFVHGVGLGLTPYLDFLKRLRELRSSGGHRPPMLVLELPFVSQRLAGLWSLPQEVRTTEEIGRAMARHQMPRATFVGHSLGTVYMSWVAKLRPELLASCVFIDPIVFLLHQRKVAHAFIYDKPARNDPQAQVETFFVKSERSTATYFHRHFYWFSNILWANEIPAPSAVVLAADDSIVPVENVAAYLHAQRGEEASSIASHDTKHAIREVVTLKDMRHGQFLVDEKARARVISAVADAQAWARRDDKPRQPGRVVSSRLRRQSKKSLPLWTSLVENPPFPQMALGEVFAI